MPSLEDKRLPGVADSNTGARQTWYDRHGPLCYGLALRLLAHDHGAADDVVHDVFVHAARSSSAVRVAPELVQTWLLTMTRNACLAVMPSRNGLPAAPSAPPGHQSVAAVHPLSGDTVRRALDGLSVEERHALELASFQGMTCGEIAHYTAASSETVKALPRSGLHAMRVRL